MQPALTHKLTGRACVRAWRVLQCFASLVVHRVELPLSEIGHTAMLTSKALPPPLSTDTCREREVFQRDRRKQAGLLAHCVAGVERFSQIRT